MSAPETDSLAAAIVAQVSASIEQTVPLLPRAVIRVLARVLAGGLMIVYRYAGFAQLQMFVRTASGRATMINGREVTPLAEWGRLFRAGDPLAATRAVITVRVTVDAQGGVIAAGERIVYPATGVVYLTTGTVALDAQTVTVIARATSAAAGDGAGAAGNAPIGAEVQFARPIAGARRAASVTGHVAQGAEAEDIEAYRARVLRLAQRPPQGGALADYREWALTVSGIVAAYVYRGAPGEVEVYVAATETSSGSADGIPSPAQLAAVAEAIERDEAGMATRRPVSALVHVRPVTRRAFDVRVTGLDATDADAAKAAIEASIASLLSTREPFILGLSTLPRLDRVTRDAVAGAVYEAVSAAGAAAAQTDVIVGGVVTPAYILAPGELAKLGTITYV